MDRRERVPGRVMVAMIFLGLMTLALLIGPRCGATGEDPKQQGSKQGSTECEEANRATVERENAERAIVEGGRLLDVVERQLGEWGHASISDFVLVPHVDDREGPFQLAHNDATSNYLARLRTGVQGRAAFLDKRSLDLEAQARFQNSLAAPAPAVDAAAATRSTEIAELEHRIRLAQLERLLEAVETATNSVPTNLFQAQPPGATGGVTNILNVTNITTTVVVSNGPAPRAGTVDSNGFGALLGSMSAGNQLSETTLLKLAGTAKITERTLNFISHPVGLAGNRQAYFAVGQISVFPGWRTKRDYVCEVSVRFTPASAREDFVAMATKRAVGLGKNGDAPTDLPPVVHANTKPAVNAGIGPASVSLVSAFPLVEAQVFDQQSTIQRQFSLLLDLAGTFLQAGYKVDARTVLKFARELQKDLSTRNALPLVVPGVDAATLTYRFDPEVSAMLDPAERTPRAGAQLLPTTIPVLVLMVTDREEIRQWTKMAMEIETRWIPRSRRNGWAEALWDVPIHWRTRDKRMSHADSLAAAVSFDKAFDVLSNPGVRELESGMELRRRVSVLQTLGFGRTVYSPLPRPGPRVTRLAPGAVEAGQAVEFELLGQDLNRSATPPVVTIGGVPLEVVSAADTRLKCRFSISDGKVPAHLEPGQYDLRMETDHGIQVVAKALTVARPQPPGPRSEIVDPRAGTIPRPGIQVVEVMPANGFFNGPTLVTLRGEGFQPRGYHDPVVLVTIGGRPVTSLRVINDRFLTFEVPAWTATNKADGFVYATRKAPVMVASSLTAARHEGLVFDVLSPPAVPAAPPVSPDLSPGLKEQARVLESLLKLLNQDKAEVRGGIQIGVGPVPPADGAPQAAGSGGPGSPTIIQVDNGPSVRTP